MDPWSWAPSARRAATGRMERSGRQGVDPRGTGRGEEKEGGRDARMTIRFRNSLDKIGYDRIG